MQYIAIIATKESSIHIVIVYEANRYDIHVWCLLQEDVGQLCSHGLFFWGKPRKLRLVQRVNSQNYKTILFVCYISQFKRIEAMIFIVTE